MSESENAEEKEENHCDRILDSPACRTLFAWARPANGDARLAERDAEVKREQRLRWNFDFETETPLPGRYQWRRVEGANGARKNGHKRLRNGQHSTHHATEPAECRDRPLDGPRRSERISRLQIDDASPCRLPWN